jgi:PAS domain S-box-containing protein
MQTEKPLHISEKQCRTAINSLIDPVHVVDRDLKIVLFNEAFKKWNQELGLNPAGIGKTIYEIFPFLPKTIQEQYEQVFTTGTILITKEKIVINNKEYSTETEKIPIYDDNHVGQVITVIHDITAQIKVEEALRESEERYRLLVDNLADGVALVQEGKHIYLNPAFCDIFGYTPEELLGSNPEMLIAPEQKPQIQTRLQLRAKGEIVPSHYETTGLRKDGRKIALEVFGSFVFYNNKSTIQVTVREITLRKQMEEKIQQLNQQLERRILELVVTNKSLEEYDYSISHDLRGPLQAIKGATFILSEHYAAQLDHSGKESIKLIEKNLFKMERMVVNLLNYSRFDRQALNIIEIDLHELVTELINESQSIYSVDRDLRPELNPQWEIYSLPKVNGDYDMLQAVFSNLLTNALKFTRKKTVPKIEIGAKLEPEQVVIYVKDNGIGYDMQKADKLFEVFHRMHASAEYEGTGVGLAIVHRAIQRHGGKVWAEGIPNHGATFYFSLPKNPA